jgi:hypothetical protein
VRKAAVVALSRLLEFFVAPLLPHPLPSPPPLTPSTLQLSVRKAAVVALSRLLEFFAQERSIAAAWVRSALPAVRDVEQSIQEALCEWGEALLLQRAAAAAALADPRQVWRRRMGAGAGALLQSGRRAKG